MVNAKRFDIKPESNLIECSRDWPYMKHIDIWNWFTHTHTYCSMHIMIFPSFIKALSWTKYMLRALTISGTHSFTPCSVHETRSLLFDPIFFVVLLNFVFSDSEKEMEGKDPKIVWNRRKDCLAIFTNEIFHKKLLEIAITNEQQ